MKGLHNRDRVEEKAFFYGTICLGVVFIAIGLSSSLAADQADSPKGPISRKEFVEIVSLGMPEDDLREAIGDPDAELQSKEPQFSDLLYRRKILAKSGGREDVKIILFKDYRNVYAIEWADGSRIER